MHSTSGAYGTFSASRIQLNASNSEVRSKTGQPLITINSRALRASLNPASNWRRPPGRPLQTWLPTISDDLKHLNISLPSSTRSSFTADDRGNSYAINNNHIDSYFETRRAAQSNEFATPDGSCQSVTT